MSGVWKAPWQSTGGLCHLLGIRIAKPRSHSDHQPAIVSLKRRGPSDPWPMLTEYLRLEWTSEGHLDRWEDGLDIILFSMLWWLPCLCALRHTQVKESGEWNSWCLLNTLSFPSKKYLHQFFLLERKMCGKCLFLFWFLDFSLGWETCAIKGSHVCPTFPGSSVSFGEALGGGERHKTFHSSFGCLIPVKFTYWSALFPSPHLRNFSLLFFWKL